MTVTRERRLDAEDDMDVYWILRLLILLAAAVLVCTERTPAKD